MNSFWPSEPLCSDHEWVLRTVYRWEVVVWGLWAKPFYDEKFVASLGTCTGLGCKDLYYRLRFYSFMQRIWRTVTGPVVWET